MLSCSITPCYFKLLFLHLVHAELETPWGQVHPRHHRAHVQGIHGIVFVLGLEQRLLSVLVRHILPAIVDVAVEHGIAPVPSVPCVEWVMGENQSDTITQILFLVVLYLNELVSEVIVIKELVIMVSKNEMLLPLQVLQQSNSGLHVMYGNVPQNENMVFVFHYAIPVLANSVVKFLRAIQLVAGERYLILRPSDWT